MTARINGNLMSIVENNDTFVIALDRNLVGDDQRVKINKEWNNVVFTENTRHTRKQRRRIKLSPFINISNIN